ncbi:MAG: hypothetical protein ACYDH9_20810 [Limisphaerales bacterium]
MKAQRPLKAQRPFGRLLFSIGLIAACCFTDTHATNVFPVATNESLVEFSGGIATSGSNYLVGILSGTNVSVQLVSTAGALLGPPVTLGTSKGRPNVAFGGTNYLAVWEDDFAPNENLYGQIISPSGTPIGSPFSMALSSGPGGVASDGTQFLVVMQNHSNNLNNVYGQLVTSGGTPSGPAFLLSTLPANYTAVAFGKTNYLVVLKSCYGVMVATNGSVGSTFQIHETNSAANNFNAVAFDGTNYLAAWMWNSGPDTGGNLTNWKIHARLVSQTGTFPGNELALVAAPGNHVIPSLAFDGSYYALTWGASTATDANIRFQFFDRSASAIGPQFALFAAQGANVPLFAFNGLVFDGTRFAAAATLGTVATDTNGNFLGFPSADVFGTLIPASTAAPQLAVAAPFTNQRFSLSLIGTPGINYAIQTLLNISLTNWIALTTNSPTNGTFSFTDLNATNASRFYRAVKQ